MTDPNFVLDLADSDCAATAMEHSFHCAKACTTEGCTTERHFFMSICDTTSQLYDGVVASGNIHDLARALNFCANVFAVVGFIMQPSHEGADFEEVAAEGIRQYRQNLADELAAKSKPVTQKTTH